MQTNCFRQWASEFGALVYDYLILTAAITRPDLHSLIFPAHRAFINGARVRWIIHVDDIRNGYSTRDTVANFQRILDAPNIDLEFIERPGQGCFFHAARTLSERAESILDCCQGGVVWLEDDWAYGRGTPVARAMTWLRLRLGANHNGNKVLPCPGTLRQKLSLLGALDSEGSGRWFVSMVPRRRVSFNPGIWSRRLFHEEFSRPLASMPIGQVDDPESLCADPLNASERYRALTVLIDPCFQDAGRLWSARSRLRKWQKEADKLNTDGNVTYRSEPADAVASFDAEGTLLCPRLLPGTPRPVLVRIKSRQNRTWMRVLGAPIIRYELIPSGSSVADALLYRLNAWARTYPVKKAPFRLYLNEGQIVVDDGEVRHQSPLWRTVPVSQFWRIPVQCLVGIIAVTMGLIKAMARLDAERNE